MPSHIIATAVPALPSGTIPPFEVKPGHMILAPPITNGIAPLSTWQVGNRKGSNIFVFKKMSKKFINLFTNLLTFMN